MSVKGSRSTGRGLTLLLGCYFIGLILLFRPVIHGVDPVGYYSWLRSAVIDHDLDVANEFAHYVEVTPGFAYWKSTMPTAYERKTPTGYQHNQWSVGPAMLWLPLYSVAHGLVSVAHALGVPIPPDGYSWPYVLAAALSSTLYGLFAVLLIYRLGRNHFSEFTSTLAALVIWFATPLVFYMYSSPLMSHATDAFANALCLTAFARTRQGASPKEYLVLGLAIGLATWVRTQNIALFVATAVLIASEWLTREKLPGLSARSYALTAIRNITALAAGAGLLILPLSLFRRVVFGAWIVNAYLLPTDAECLKWTAPHLLEVLFSTNRGVFLWMPVSTLALVGLWQFRKMEPRLALFAALMLAQNLYVTGNWCAWSGGSSFGPRLWCNMVAPLGLGLGGLLHAWARRPRWALGSVASFFVVWNLLLLVQYSLNTIPRSGPVNVQQMVVGQFTVIPSHLTRTLNALITRR